ncbi:MAG: NAD(P)/FAD-dependent oxidoreductase [Acidimicrobiia bacterium]
MVIVGAGFAGLAAARALASEAVNVVLVDRSNHHTFMPLLYQVATAGLNAADIAHPVRAILRSQKNLAFRCAAVTAVDWTARRVLLSAGQSLPFDHLILAAGAAATFLGIPGATDHAFSLSNLSDAVALRNHVLARFEAADADAEGKTIEDGALTFVLAGGGPTGVETAGALAELFAMVLRKDFPRLDVDSARVVLVEATDRLLPSFRARSGRHALKVLRSLGVEVRLNETVAEASRQAVRLGSGEVLPAHTLVWTAGVAASPLAGLLGVECGRAGRIVVAPDLSVPGRQDVYAVGDVAAIGDGRSLPQLAPVAIQSGRHAGRQVARRVRGETTRTFRYRDRGTMATIGRRAAVAELPLRLTLTGTPAWLAWLTLHLVTLVGFRNRASVFLNWAWNYLTWDRGPRLIFPPRPLAADPGREPAPR